MKILIYVCVLLLSATLHAQACKVLLKSINETYKGDCKNGKADGIGVATGVDAYSGSFKKGLPHGEGVYTYANGDEFKGKFQKGKKEGQGILMSKNGIIKKGFWKKDRYIGLFEQPYQKLNKSPNISNYTINRRKEEINSIRFYIKENQSQVRNPNANLIVHHGNFLRTNKTSNYIEFQEVTFPFKAKAYFGQEYVEFEIFNKGLWEVKIDITKIRGLGN
ncbi:hypothetical protein MWU59_06940 [Flavobacteriaceae bacterium F08102]|nr:hypothetical protein [Flavobacteriaceae bacterium F08102]